NSLSFPALAPLPGIGGGAATFATDGGVKILSSMLNVLLDLGGKDGVGFSIGAGAGIAGVDTRVRTPDVLDSEDVAFAWQGIAALRVPVSDSVDIGLKYRYFNVENVSLIDNFARPLKADLTSHSILASLLFNWGGA